MAIEKSFSDVGSSRPTRPAVRSIGVADLKDALVEGFADFKAVPTHLIFLYLIYPIIMLVAGRMIAGYDVLPLIFPLLAGYTLVGPLGAAGMYVLSSRREQGLEVSRAHLLNVFRSPSIRALAALSGILMAVYFAWLAVALLIYAMNFGSPPPTSIAAFAQQALTMDFGGAVPASIAEFAQQVFATRSGWTLIIVGSTVGLLFAVVVLTLSVVSFPMLLDRNRNLGAVAAAHTSARAVLANPVTMAVWGLIVVAALLIGSLPFFLGLAVVLPVLGHATWHLYRKVVIS
jgi:uncharacterized membrane protein